MRITFIKIPQRRKREMPKSILKRSPAPTVNLVRTREACNRETALHHARIIQHRKDIESQILDAIETLIDFPTSSIVDSSKPTLHDADAVKSKLKQFQQSDYDALVEERNIDRRCGYVLCPQPLKQQDTNAKFRIMNGKGRDLGGLKIVETHKSEQWCSQDCARRAAYIRVQLRSEPAWVGSGTLDTHIILPEGKYVPEGAPNSDQEQQLPNLRLLSLEEPEDDISRAMRDLAIERGDNYSSSVPAGLIRNNILENHQASYITGKPPDITDRSSNLVEGHRPRFVGDKLRPRDFGAGEEDDQDIIPMI